MATITPVTTIPTTTKVPVFTWTGLSTADTATPLVIQNQTGLSAGVQITGTFGGATIVIQGSLDGSTYFTLKDVTGASISTAAANAYFEFSTSVIYIKPVSSGGAADDVNIVLTLRGPASNV